MHNFHVNPILNTDSYKASHWLQYPPGIKNVSSYAEARPGGDFDEVVFFGLRFYLEAYLSKPITVADVEQAREIVEAHGEPFNYDGWMHIVNVHGGRLPLKITALPEGTVVPAGIPLLQIEATDPACFWLVSYIETALLRALWYGSTVATYSREVKKVILSNLDMTCDNPQAAVPFMLHDFGARGVSSYESAALGGAAHLVNFLGTDTMSALSFIQSVYGAPTPGFSVPAAEHSTITSWGIEGEADAYANLIDQFDGEGKIVSIVSDSYDLWNAIDNIFGNVLKDRVLAMKGRLVVRPDSGDPATITLQAVEKLGKAFGYEINGKGYKVLNPKVRVLWGDGVGLDTVGDVLANLSYGGWSGENVVFGMGGALLQGQHRDTLRFAFKANAMLDGNDVWHDVFKKPATDPSKASKAGRQIVFFNEERGVWEAQKRTEDNAHLDALQPAFLDGEVVISDSWESIRHRAEVHV